MIDFLLAAGQGVPWQNSQLWFAIPLILAISLVYAATRHERMLPIWLHAGRIALWIFGFMAVVFGVLMVISRYA